MNEAVLDVRNLTMEFGGLRAVDSVDLQVADQQIAALIGPNGAGKTTFFNCVTGIYKPTGGDVMANPPGKEPSRLNGLKPNKVTERGLARTFQNIRLFQNMTVLENVMIGRHCRLKAGVLGAIFRNKATREEEKRVIEESYHVLKKIGLEEHVNELAKNLPYGAQRRLEIARALATEPFILLLDEPAAGMNPQETKDLMKLIYQLRENEKIAILLIEHDMSLVMSISERVFVMDYGKLIADGTPQEIKKSPAVVKAYLGEDIDA
ncbi:ABC transporter ATP-binding protein [Sediminispirochaeta smaragdinae]|jgi:branched-chain amino acid transport system ATP-binding protein|uniref:ABC transporter related protein n=1 Tax=Sediminispirochaeta smaragdinae (strain DSM 11293 / JCM 15392 / SEBR 4228) TaxID=573413 RepID=E1RAX2_SEDSS|nr:ABC transporter ATP-binding protein [Sediminispirochaeta smaragdinae]ADK79502.1 ABC transporter related protein [Sediminispirochaeta smaragdinae DSM 11293]